jgi:putative membrane protein
MKRLLMAIVLATVSGASALGQSSSAPITAPSAINPAAPVPGANSFTETQAKDRIEKSGYSSVSGLTKDANGVWRGKASKDGNTSDVSLDYQGNVSAK